MAATLKDVAARAGVSTSAVSRTFTDGASVSARMRHKVETAARELGYRPNALASSLTTGRTKLVGLVSDNFRNPIFLEVFDLFTRALQDIGLRPLLVNLSQEKDPQHSVRMLTQYSVDGVVVASSTLPPAFAEAYNARATAYFQMGRYGQSLADIRQTLLLNPRHFNAMSGLALILEEIGEPEGALQAWREVERLHPNREGLSDAVQRLARQVEGAEL